MITHDQVKSVVQHMEWQIAAWRQIKERNPSETVFVHYQINYLLGKIEQLEEWQGERWGGL